MVFHGDIFFQILNTKKMSSTKVLNICFVFSHPTQFEGPFFQLLHEKRDIKFEVLYFNNDRFFKNFDKELKFNIDWGINILSGYVYDVFPNSNWKYWLIKKFLHNKYDLVIINGYYDKKLIWASFLSSILMIPLYLRLDTVDFNKKINLKKLIKVRLLRFLYNGFLAVGSLTENYLIKYGVPKRKISIFSYSVDSHWFKQKSEHRDLYIKSHPTTKIILTVTKLNEREAPYDIIYALSKLERRKCKLLIIGDGPLKNKLVELCTALGINEDVEFCGYVQYTKLSEYYKAADIFIHPAYYEPWGVSVHEAISCGLPVIYSEKVGSGYDLVKEGYNGYRYNYGDVPDLLDKINLLISGIPDSETIKKTNEVKINEWSYEKMYKNLLCLKK